MGSWIRAVAAMALFLIAVPGCYTRHKLEMEPVEIKPIHITIDVNVRVERALDDFFADIDEAAQNTEAGPEGR